MIDDLAQKVRGLGKRAGRNFRGFAILGHVRIVEKTPAQKEKSPQTVAGSIPGSIRELIFYESLFTCFLNRRQGHNHHQEGCCDEQSQGEWTGYEGSEITA